MHPIGQTWVDAHPDAIEGGGTTSCQDCHGSDYRGTVLSRSQADRTLSTDFGPKHFWRGFQIGCYTCHQGPDRSRANPNHAPVAGDASASSRGGKAVNITLVVHDDDGDPLTLRVVSQPMHGAATVTDTTATYFAEPGVYGEDSFTFAASDGSTDSNLATVSVTVTQSCPGDCGDVGVVTVDELIVGVSMALGAQPLAACPSFDRDGDGAVTVDELLAAIDAALNGCG